MNNANSGASTTRLWQLGRVGERVALRLGRRWLWLDEVDGYGVTRVAERDNEGLLLNFALFGLLACAFVIPVIENVMEPKFLIAAGLLAAVALMSLGEVVFAARIESYRLDFTMLTGETISFLSTNEADVRAILGLLPRDSALA